MFILGDVLLSALDIHNADEVLMHADVDCLAYKDWTELLGSESDDSRIPIHLHDHGRHILHAIRPYGKTEVPMIPMKLIDYPTLFRAADYAESHGGAYATDPRDLVYAMLNLARPYALNAVDMPVADYTIPVEQVYAQMTKCIMDANPLDPLRVLRWCSSAWDFSGTPDWTADVGFRARLPSWAVDFSRGPRTAPFPSYLTPYDNRLTIDSGLACRYRKHTLAPGDSWHVLTTLGMKIDEVNRAAPAACEHAGFLRDYDLVTKQAFEAACLQTGGQVTDKARSRPWKKIRAVIGGFIAARFSRITLPPAKASLPSSSHPEQPSAGAPLSSGYGYDAGSMHQDFLVAIEKWLDSYLHSSTSELGIFHGKNGRLGLAPRGALDGDIVAILHGVNFPVILRQVPGTRQYSFGGYCYFQDAMRGQSCTWAEEEADVIELV